MTKYNSRERYVAKLLGNFPHLKDKLKISYQFLSSILYKKKYSNKLLEGISLKNISRQRNCSAFWGYYDKSPVMNNNYAYQLCPSSQITKRDKSSIKIILNDKVVSETQSWNWQQGSMLTWLNDEELIHNFYEKDSYKSKILNVKNNKSRIIDFPIYSVNSNKRISISLNFSRLSRLRPDYGYFNLDWSSIKKIDKDDGVFLIDLEKNTKNLVISFEQLLQFNYREDMKTAWHKVNHIEISPNGERFMFIHRWLSDSGLKKSRLISANINGNDMFILSDDDMVSHCTWKNNEEIVGWMSKKGIGDHYYLLHDKTHKFEILGEHFLVEDGHPSFSKDEKWMLTDTYPDKSRMSTLLLYNMLDEKLYKLGEFYSALKYSGEVRCDLHPRFNDCNTKITFDSVHDGVRNIIRN